MGGLAVDPSRLTQQQVPGIVTEASYMVRSAPATKTPLATSQAIIPSSPRQGRISRTRSSGISCADVVLLGRAHNLGLRPTLLVRLMMAKLQQQALG
jgi:hypothetical protein